MKKQKLLTLVLSFSMIFATGIGAFADTQETTEIPETTETPVFADMPNNWSTTALQNAIDNGLLSGYEVDGVKLIKPDGKLTRAEMATIMNNAFNASAKADMTGVSDVADQWYTDHMAVSVQMEGLSKAANMRPNDNITREEAFTVLAKVFKLEDSQDYTKLDTYSDQDKISAYAKDRIAVLLNEGYISGDGNRIKPLENITRAEFAAMMNNIVSQYIMEEGEVTDVVTGNVLINTANVTLKDVEIDGDLILADGIDSGEVKLEDVTVTGTVIVRGGGENSVHISGDSQIENMLVSNLNNAVRIHASDDIVIGQIKANKQVILDGKFTNVVLQSEGTVVTAAPNAVIDNADLAAAGSVLQGQGNVKNAKINANNGQVNTNKTEITVAQDVTGASSGSTSLNGGSTHTSGADTSGQTPAPSIVAPVIKMTGSENPVTVGLHEAYEENAFGLISGTFDTTDMAKVTAILTKGSENFKNVRLVAVAEDGSDLTGLQLIVKDPGSDNYYNFLKAGWGPLEGFALADYTADVFMVASQAGTYQFKVQLIDVSNGNKVITESVAYTIIAE